MTEAIIDTITKLRALTEVDVQNYWRCCTEDLPVSIATEPASCQNWPIAELNTKKYIVWSAGQQVIWLGQNFTIPQDLQGYPLTGLALRLTLTWWAVDTKIFVNGKLVQQGDLFDSSARVLLSDSVVPGETITVALRLVSPGHDIGALMRSLCLYESTDDIDPSFIANTLTILQKYAANFAPETLETLTAAVAEIDWDTLSQQEAFRRSRSVGFTQSLSNLHQSLQPLLEIPSQRRIQMLGHAHLDLAWLWTVSETWEVAQRTFESVLNLQQEFPELTFCHSTPALYAWIEQNRPDLFKAIQQQIAAGRWEVVGGMWVEPELNLINGESIVRQVLYAQRYVQEKFGQLTKVAWVPDSFGFCWQLPQILKQGGIEYFVTQKLHWNDTTKFPHGIFWWRSPDGTQIFSLMSPPNTTGVMDTNPITMTSYGVDWELQTNLKNAFWLPGVGDHGGGPTRDMLQVAQRWQNSPFFPQLEFTTAHSYLSEVSGQSSSGQTTDQEIFGHNSPNLFVDYKQNFSLFQDKFLLGDDPKSKIQNPKSNDIPIWNDELYLEFHRGCYTTHADQKRWNRRCEGLLYEAELFASLATISAGVSYPKLQLEDAWKKVLFNQFHDILPGTSIPEVFVEANQAWEEVEEVGLEILNKSLGAIASQITLPSPPQPNAQPIIVFNSLNWPRSEVVSVSFPKSDEVCWEVYDFSGEKLPSQLIEESKLLFLAKDIPSVGYRVFWLCRCDEEDPTTEVAATQTKSACADYNTTSLDLTSFAKDPTTEVAAIQTKSACADYNTTSLDLTSFAKDPTTEVAAIQTKSACADYDDATSVDLTSLASVAPPFRVWDTTDDDTSVDPSFKVWDTTESNNWVLENEVLRVVVDPDTGDLSSIYDKVSQREVLSGPGNQLQAFQDSGQYWDAWNIDPNYKQHPLPPTQLKSIQWMERGLLQSRSVGEAQSRLRVVRQLGKSLFCQDYLLSCDSPILQIVTTVDWQERHVLVKAAFPLTFEAKYAVNEIACGAIQRPTIPQTTAEQAKWEVSALRWADLGDEEYGVSLLNDCKYGYDYQPSELRLTLLRSPCWPDPDADRGIHQFTYALYPHRGSWQSAGTVRRGYELNLPLMVFSMPKAGDTGHTTLAPVGKFLDLQAENLVLMAFKQSEDSDQDWILRCYEAHGDAAEFSLASDLDLAIAHKVNLLEEEVITQNGQTFKLCPWEIASFAVSSIVGQKPKTQNLSEI
ncbi:MAG: alpha-mannosidase [Potamolinea sp.]